MSLLPDHEIALEIGGAAYFGWTELSVERGIATLVGSFELTLSAKERTDAEDWPIDDGAECRILLAGEVLITGYVDAIERFVDAEERGITVRGRDKAADLVDCSAIHVPGSWQNKKLEAIAGELTKPFGISITVTGDTGAPFKRFALQQGETVFSAIERMTRYRGLVAFSPGDGSLRVGSPDTGERTGRLEEGVNVKRAEASRDNVDRFSDYIAKGQSSGDDQRHGKAVAQVTASAKDSEITRYRPLLVIGEEQSDKSSLGKRAQWEAAVRSGRAKPATVTVAGWLDGDGRPWRPAARSACQIPSVKLMGDMLIERVTLRRSAEDGTEAELGIVAPEAWTQLAEPEPKDGA